ncbi:hypothetical protein RHMOL_Rhmol06G0067900 [Rhododendron molle]|uniref:Uncharacterized protein n=1 Tax=Rhododendron molle TaxID=49168 RepID=A0ACC0NAS1_RHOML|nr:hypothetical protein RHMOL_Rhmol06G0067900 [Rhododendron molle]
MDFSLCFFLILPLFFTPSSSTPPSSISEGSSLSVDRPNDFLTSPNGVFTSGFYRVGDNAFIYAVWFAKSFDRTVVWTANRDQPVNGKGSKLLLQKGGELMLTDAGKNTIWTAAAAATTTTSTSVQLSLNDTGNLVLSTSSNTSPIRWQSFDSPTNTLLPHQLFTRYTTLISSRSEKNYSSSFYKLFFDNDNVLRLLYSGPEVSSIYWPDPWLMVWDTGRTTYNSSKVAVFDSSGHFRSSDNLEFNSSDSGLGPKRRLTLDTDGNLRLYSLNEMTGNWTITWQAMSDPCRVHGICGPNSICSYGSGAGRGCFCVPGYRIRNSSDWSYGCDVDQGYYLSGDNQTVDFVSMGYLELFGYDYDFYENHTLKSCKEKCLNSAICKGFLFKFVKDVYNCYAKSQLLNGKSSPNLLGTLYVKLNVSVKDNSFKPSVKQIQLNCSGGDPVTLNRTYETKGGSEFLEFLTWFAAGVGVVEMLCVFVICFLVFRTPKDSGPDAQGKKTQGAVNSKALVKEIIDPTLIGGCDMGKMETLVRVAMLCVEEDKDARPTMRNVVEMLLRHEDFNSCDNGAEVKDIVPFQ